MNAPIARPLSNSRPSLATPALLALALLVALAILPPSARAEAMVPTLLGTQPDSPGISTEPRIHGRLGGVGTSAMPVTAGFGPVRSVADPNGTVTIYTDDDCIGTVAATGTVAELEGVGIAVVVAPGSMTTFYANEAEAGETSGCSEGLIYRHVSSAPPAPVLDSVSPASPADDNLPRVLGSADPDATIEIYADPGCTGPVVATGSGEVLGAGGIAVSVPDNSTTTFHATAAWAGLASECSSSSVTYQEVTVPPQEPPTDPGGPGDSGGDDDGSPPPELPGKPAAPKLHTAPGGRANDATPLVAGSAPKAVRVDVFISEDCERGRVASGSPAELAAGFPVRVEPNSTTSFYGISTAADGDRSRCSPEPAVYVEDSAPPLTRITFGPGVKTRKRSAVFRFADVTGDPPGTSFACKLDGRRWTACQSPWRVPQLRVRAHVVRIRATDLAGNQESVGAKRRFKVVARQAR